MHSTPMQNRLANIEFRVLENLQKYNLTLSDAQVGRHGQYDNLAKLTTSQETNMIVLATARTTMMTSLLSVTRQPQQSTSTSRIQKGFISKYTWGPVKHKDNTFNVLLGINVTQSTVVVGEILTFTGCSTYRLFHIDERVSDYLGVPEPDQSAVHLSTLNLRSHSSTGQEPNTMH